MILKKNEKGAVLVFTVLITGLASVLALVTLTRASIDSFVDSQDQKESIAVRALLMGCLDEVLLQFSVDPNYSDVQVVIPDAICEMSIVNTGANTREVDLSLESGQVTRSVHLELSVASLNVTNIIEQ